MSTAHRKLNPTKSNHINPCFWTALWNENYFNDFMNNRNPRKRSREQAVYLLDFKIPKIIQQKTQNIHAVEALGIAIVSGEELLNIRKLFTLKKIFMRLLAQILTNQMSTLTQLTY